MKKISLLILCFASVLTQAQQLFYYNVGADLVTDYIWRGSYSGGLSFQPSVMGGVGNDDYSFDLSVWGNIGATDYTFKDIPGYVNPEIDFMGNLYVQGITAGFNHYWYCGKYGKGEVDYQTEVYLGYDFTRFLYSSELSLTWYTMVAGDDYYNDQRAYSSYVELVYTYNFDPDISLGFDLGLTPFRSFYTDYEGTFAFNNITIHLSKSWNCGGFYVSAFGQLTINAYTMTQEGVNPVLANIGCSININN